MATPAIEPADEWNRYGHSPKPCRAERADCPPGLHCGTCAKTIVEGYRPGYFDERIWTHDVSAAS